MCAGNNRYTLCMASRLRTSQHFSRHLRTRSPSHAVFPTFPAHISTPKPTSAQPNPDSRPEWHPPRAHVLSLSPKTPFCHSEPPSCHSERQRRICFLPSHILLFSFSRHVCRQPSIYALYGIPSAHFSAFLLTSAQPILDSRPEWHPLCAHVLSLSFRAPFCHSERQRRICFLPSHILLFSFYPTSAQAIPFPRRIFNFPCTHLNS